MFDRSAISAASGHRNASHVIFSTVSFVLHEDADQEVEQQLDGEGPVHPVDVRHARPLLQHRQVGEHLDERHALTELVARDELDQDRGEDDRRPVRREQTRDACRDELADRASFDRHQDDEAADEEEQLHSHEAIGAELGDEGERLDRGCFPLGVAASRVVVHDDGEGRAEPQKIEQLKARARGDVDSRGNRKHEWSC
nr:hypothetical protein [Microbacterium oleivorans]